MLLVLEEIAPFTIWLEDVIFPEELDDEILDADGSFDVELDIEDLQIR